jgi:hypothetical protein
MTLFNFQGEWTMKSKLVKVVAAAALLAASGATYASCCDGLDCCLQMLACCFG